MLDCAEFLFNIRRVETICSTRREWMRGTDDSWPLFTLISLTPIRESEHRCRRIVRRGDDLAVDRMDDRHDAKAHRIDELYYCRWMGMSQWKRLTSSVSKADVSSNEIQIDQWNDESTRVVDLLRSSLTSVDCNFLGSIPMFRNTDEEWIPSQQEATRERSIELEVEGRLSRFCSFAQPPLFKQRRPNDACKSNKWQIHDQLMLLLTLGHRIALDGHG